jgi:hypothetical protein
MEQWKAELQRAIDVEVEESDGEFEEQFLQEMISNLDREMLSRRGQLPEEVVFQVESFCTRIGRPATITSSMITSQRHQRTIMSCSGGGII